VERFRFAYRNGIMGCESRHRIRRNVDSRSVPLGVLTTSLSVAISGRKSDLARRPHRDVSMVSRLWTKYKAVRNSNTEEKIAKAVIKYSQLRLEELRRN
jgi:hypothetical protein